MYSVSQAVKNEYKSLVSVHRVRGTIGTSGGTMSFNTDNVMSGSCVINNKCADGDTLIGTVYIGELTISFLRNLIIPRGDWKGRPITIEFGVDVNNVTTWIPMGVYYISKASHSASGVSITAYDAMQKLDKKFGISTTSGTMYQLLNMACVNCGVQLGMTENEINALPNGSEFLILYTDNDIETYRDFVSWIAQTTGTFATIDRNGRLVLRQYHTMIDDEITPPHRARDGIFSDFSTYISGVSVVDAVEKKTYYYGDLEDDTGTTYNLGTNPLLQNIIKTRRETICRRILGELEKIRFTPYTITVLENPLYDLGDVIKFSDGIADDSSCCVMQYIIDFGQSLALEGIGSDPALANARSKTDKNIAGLMANTEANELQYYTYTNAEDYVIHSNSEKPVISIRFTTISSVHVTFHAEILCDCDCVDEMLCTVKYRKNGVLQNYQPKEQWIDGKHILSLFFPIVVEQNTVYNWVVYLRSGDGKITIPAQNIHAMIWGQGLVAVSEWDGFIDVFEKVPKIDIDSDIDIKPISGSVTNTLITPKSTSHTEHVSAISLDDGFDVKNVSDKLLMNKKYMINETWAQLAEKTWAELNDDYVWG